MAARNVQFPLPSLQMPSPTLRTSGLGALLLVGVMAGAVFTHVFIVGGSPLMAIILLVVTGLVAWGRRRRTMSLLTGL
jgi:Flp pilus assembly protein TadB